MKLVLGKDVGLSPGDLVVLDGDPVSLLQKGAEPPSPIFGPFLLCPNGWMHQNATRYGGRPQPRRVCVRWGPSLPRQKAGGGAPPTFSAHVYCGQTAGWIKMALGMEVGLGPGYIVLDGEPAPLPKREQSSPIFGPFLLSPNGWMNQDGTWHGGGPWSKPHCARWGPSSPLPKWGHTPNFRPIFIVAKRMDASRCHLVWR